MSIWKFAIRNLIWFRRSHVALIASTAVATAILTGALIVGDSMRHSLRSLVLDRLGQIDTVVISQGAFGVPLAKEGTRSRMYQEQFSRSVPAIVFLGGTVEAREADELGQPGGVATSVAVYGVTQDFWSLEGNGLRSDLSFPDKNSVIVNRALADELKIGIGQETYPVAQVTLRIPKRNLLPGDSAMGKKKDLIESLVDLQVAHVVPDQGLGRFGLHPTQTTPLNIFVPIELIQESLSYTIWKHKPKSNLANAIFLQRRKDRDASVEASEFLFRELGPTLEDCGLSLRRITREFGYEKNRQVIFDYWSLASDRLVFRDDEVATIQSAFPDAKPVFVYLANEIRLAHADGGVPFSMVAAIDFDETFQPLSAIDGRPVKALGRNELVLNGWAADDLGAKVGDTIAITYFEPETAHGEQVERSVEMTLVDIAQLAEPSEPWVASHRGGWKQAEFNRLPQITNDPFLTPEVPGLTDSETIDRWDLPFETAGKIRSQDDEYWSNHRTTPKAFVSLETGQQLWNSRFGKTTSFRIAAKEGDRTEVAERLERAISTGNASFGFQVIPVRRRGLEAAKGSTPFDALFLALSGLVIVSALILVSLMFRLGLQQRATEIGLLSAVGLSESKIRRLWFIEMVFVTLVSVVPGVLLGMGYAGVILYGLRTWWVGAVSTQFLYLHVEFLTLVVGAIGGLVASIVTIFWSLRVLGQRPVREKLNGNMEPWAVGCAPETKHWLVGLPAVLLVLAAGFAFVAADWQGELRAGAFLAGGFLALVGMLLAVFRWIKKPEPDRRKCLSLVSLAIINGKRNPMRSTLTMGLVAVASFLIVAVSAFRLAPTERGTGGYDWLARSSQPILEDLATPAGRSRTLGDNHGLVDGIEIVPFRYKSGEDASCNNLYQSTQPQVLGVLPDFVEQSEAKDGGREGRARFSWSGSLAETDRDRSNPWRLLGGEKAHAGTESDPIPVVIDKNTANYSLKVFSLGSVLVVNYDSGERVHFRVVGFLSNSIFQGSLMVSEVDFVKAFPTVSGYQVFLIRDGQKVADDSLAGRNVEILESQLSDYGFDVRPTRKILTDFMAVQNTYLSAFQSIGALGLLLGTMGLAAVQWRNVLERRKELGLMQATGFSRKRLGWMVFWESGFLLFVGLGVGGVAALFTTLPHWLWGEASVPWSSLALMFALIASIGLIVSVGVSWRIFRLPLLERLRSGG